MSEKLLGRSLPKWPQMRVLGKKITEEQAFEIIRRTDTFMYHGYKYSSNDHQGDLEMAKMLGMTLREDDGGEFEDSQYYEEFRKWVEEWGSIQNEYVTNNWLSSAFIGGPHGWCNPNGNIYYEDNIGKWPEIEYVLKEWEKIAEAFPFLNLDAVLYNGESGEIGNIPIIRFHIENGKVEVFDPLKDGLGMVEEWGARGNFTEQLFLTVRMPSSMREHHPRSKEMIEYWMKEKR